MFFSCKELYEMRSENFFEDEGSEPVTFGEYLESLGEKKCVK